MTCEECNQRPATVHFTKIVNGEKSEAHLCHECAGRHEEMAMVAEPTFTFNNILQSLFQSPVGVTETPHAVQPKVRCHSCGLSFGDVRQRGHLGCSECYTQFAEQLEPLIRRVHSATQHVGKRPEGEPPNDAAQRKKLEDLRSELRRSIGEEAYERAAELRDEIRRIERQLGGEG